MLADLDDRAEQALEKTAHAAVHPIKQSAVSRHPSAPRRSSLGTFVLRHSVPSEFRYTSPVSALRRFFDVRPGEGRLVALTFLYVALAVASFLLAKPIRNGLFLSTYGAYKLVYVYVAVPIVLSIGLPLYTRLVARVGSRKVVTGSLVFFCLNVVGFWYAFRLGEVPGLPAIFYVWVNCFGIIAPVQAWTFANLHVRHPTGAAAVRADRKRCQPGRDSRRAAGARAGAATGNDQPAAGAGGTHRCWPRSSSTWPGTCRRRVGTVSAGRTRGDDAGRILHPGRDRRRTSRLIAAHGVRGGHRHAVDAVPVQPGGRGAICRRSRSADALLRHRSISASASSPS